MFTFKILKCLKINSYWKHYSTRNIIKLKERGMFVDLFPDVSVTEITDLLNARAQTVYAGFDPTSSTLHVGNLLVLINLLHWQRGGHNVIAVVGGATARIGDPSGRTSERQPLTSDVIDTNILGIRSNILKVFENHEKYFWTDKNKQLPPIKVLNNEDWYKNISAVDLLGGAGRYLRMGIMLSRTSVKTRLEMPSGMSFTEFSYQLFQSYDWLHLLQKYRCKFQIGGNDQMGNIMSGYELITKMCKQTVYGLTLPLITTEMGDKFGKSAGNAIWLSSDMTSPFNFYQFWIRTQDADVERLLKLFTFEPIGAISDIMRRHKEHPERRLAQKHLAEQITLLIHGEKGLEQARTASEALYDGNIAVLGKMSAEEVADVFQGAVIVQMLPEPGQNVLEMALKAGCFLSSNDAVRIITAGGFYINQQKATNPSEILNPQIHRLANNTSLVRVGKKNYYIIKWFS